jgi:hypothetical protein
MIGCWVSGSAVGIRGGISTQHSASRPEPFVTRCESRACRACNNLMAPCPHHQRFTCMFLKTVGGLSVTIFTVTVCGGRLKSLRIATVAPVVVSVCLDVCCAFGL